MTTFYAYVPRGEIDDGDDPISLLATAQTKPDLLAIRSYNPDDIQIAARSALVAAEEDDVIRNRKTGGRRAVKVCSLDDGQ